MNKFADKIKAKTLTVQMEHLAQIEAEAKVKAEELKSDIRARCRQKNEAFIKSEIEKAAEKGYNTCRINIFQWQDNTPDWTDDVSQHVIKIIERLGFKWEEEYDTMEPYGSDPLFTNTVYSLDIRINW